MGLADGNLIAVDPEEAPAVACPSCGASLDSWAVLCAKCGYNRETGKGPAKKARKSTGSKRSLGAFMPSFSLSGRSMPPVLAFIIPMAVLVPFYLAAKDNQELALIYLLCAGLFSLAIFLSIVVASARDGKVILCLFVPFYAPVYVFTMSESSILKWMTVAAICANVSTRML